ncbi:EAL domain-containing protein [Silanimonas sp.]|jgi:EAL domain-containing protein (putative c-di-GMP-specific phosphodiesterase class I)/GGDEF domain-containing protein/CheY-like chemotaxis protein|uniref:putative bifunctional diguanylate cyclase/phosphodiesterase n=1 Tax=Silanimonas sp. TaxID=1929290 RepID=UPI0022CC2DED|nr:EAL domain-containing protein [Silanimonas sp.]MCZ8115649.1 EAL domain-containing protein [Silanimonas sp.]
MNDEWISFAKEAEEGGDSTVPGWCIVVVDDDEEVHEATRFALRHVHVHGRPLELVHLFSATEARRVLPTLDIPAVILLDVVMETENAGLDLVDFIRNDCELAATRIVLRTGQPGYAPELSVFARYDINDYFTKAELSRTRLITAITSAVKSHEQIRTIDESRRGLELIVRSSPSLLQPQGLANFAEGVLTQAKALLRAPIDGIVCAQRGSPLDPNDNRLYVVGAAGALAGAVWHPLSDLHAEPVVAAIARALRERRNVHGDDYSVLYMSTREREAAIYVATPTRLNDVDHQLLEVFASNLSACFSNLQHFEEVHRLAFRDPLTGLMNRSGLLRELDGVAGRQDLRLVLVDIDHFTDFNDGLGQEAGDLLLSAVGQRLRERFGGHASLARIGADVFAVVGEAERLAPSELQAAFEPPFACGEHLTPARVTLGLCDLGDCTDGVTALRHANIALKAAKRSLNDSALLYQAGLAEHTRHRLGMLGQLRRDLEGNRLEVWYQPQVGLADGRTHAVEALLRWPDGRGGWVQPPNVFIPLAEYSGLIVPMGEFVLDRACGMLAGLGNGGRVPERMAVNVAMPQLRDPGFVAMVERTLKRHGLAGDRLELEITESIAMDEALALRRSLEHLRSLGVRVAIDDFGTGYSSLAQLRALPVDALKIDRRFVSERSEGPDEAFVECIVGLARRLGLSTVAEGIETEEQARLMQALGCELGQGYWHARPMPEAMLRQWLAQRGTG